MLLLETFFFSLSIFNILGVVRGGVSFFNKMYWFFLSGGSWILKMLISKMNRLGYCEINFLVKFYAQVGSSFNFF